MTLQAVSSMVPCLTLPSLQASRHALRETWAAWNPQRAASHKLQQQVQSGQISLEDTVTALRQAVSSSSSSSQNEGMPWEVSAAEAKARGWHCHAGPFVWPAPKDAQVCCTASSTARNEKPVQENFGKDKPAGVNALNLWAKEAGKT